MTSKNISYIGKLDHLRFFAAALVGMYHTYYFQSPVWTGFQDARVKAKGIFSAFLMEGHTGVGLFLVLSGFIFAAIGYGRSINYRSFVMNRVLRIVPLFASVMFIAAILSAASFNQMLATMFFPFPANETVNYVPMTPHLWTIRVEFQFYLLFPFIIAFISRQGLRYAYGLLVLLITIRTMVWWSPEHKILKDLAYGTLVGRLDQFVIGMMAGCIYSGRHRWCVPGWFKHWLWPVVAAVLPLVTVFWFHRMGGYWKLKETHGLWVIWVDIEALVWATFVLAYVSCPLDWPKRVSQLLSWLGTLSFSLYVNHWLFVHDFPVARYVPQLSKNLPTNAALVFLWIVLPVLVLFSWLTFTVIERPFFMMRKSYIEKDKELEETVTREKA